MKQTLIKIKEKHDAQKNQDIAEDESLVVDALSSHASQSDCMEIPEDVPNHEQSGGFDDYYMAGNTLAESGKRSSSSFESGSSAKGKAMLDIHADKIRSKSINHSKGGFCGGPEDACCSIF